MSEHFTIGLTKLPVLLYEPHPMNLADGSDRLYVLMTLVEARRALRKTLPLICRLDSKINLDVMTAISAIDRIVPKENQ